MARRSWVIVFDERHANGNGSMIAVSTEPGLDVPVRRTSEEYALSFGDILRMLWRRLWLIALFALVFMGVAMGFSLVQTPKYEASIKMLVGQKQESGTSETNLSAGDLQGLQILTKTMAEAIDTRRVAQAVIDRLNLPVGPGTLMNGLRVEPIAETQFFKVTYEDTNPVRAQQVANTYGEVFSSQISEVSSDASAVTVTLWEEARVPDDPVSPQPLRNGLLGLMLGTMLGVTLAFLLESLSQGWRSTEEVEEISGVPTVGVIPRFAMRGEKKRG
jgi:capsular polysaccharide biosynthesis protein